MIIREPTIKDQNAFILAMQRSQALHHPWVKSPQTKEAFENYIQRLQQPNQKAFLLCDDLNNIIGVFNINEIVRGIFQSAYLGFYVVADYAHQGYMNKGLKLVLNEIFNDIQLHRIEANIQPENIPSIGLVQNNGFKKEGYSPKYLYIDEKWCDHERWTLTYEDWLRENL